MSRTLSLELHFTIEQEDDAFVATCSELDIASHGDTVEEATRRATDAVKLYLDVLVEDDELDQVLKERGLHPEPDHNDAVRGSQFTTSCRVPVVMA